MKRPSFQFYPGDWQANVKLRRCSLAARGAWIEVLCLLHGSDPYGTIDWPLADIAHATHVPLEALQELAAKSVLKGADAGTVPALIYTPRHAGQDGIPVVLLKEQPGPLWYCSRMVRDEYLRSIRGANSRFGESPYQSPKVGIGDVSGVESGDGAPSPSPSPSPRSFMHTASVSSPVEGGARPPTASQTNFSNQKITDSLMMKLEKLDRQWRALGKEQRESQCLTVVHSQFLALGLTPKRATEMLKPWVRPDVVVLEARDISFAEGIRYPIRLLEKRLERWDTLGSPEVIAFIRSLDEKLLATWERTFPRP